MIRLKKNLKGDKLIIISLLYKSLKLNQYSSKLIGDFRAYKKWNKKTPKQSSQKFN